MPEQDSQNFDTTPDPDWTPRESIAAFLRWGRDAFPTSDQAADALLKRLEYDGFEIVRKRRSISALHIDFDAKRRQFLAVFRAILAADPGLAAEERAATVNAMRQMIEIGGRSNG